MAFTRTQILDRLRAKIAERRPIIMAGAGIGLVAKILDRSGIDVLMSYNTGLFRMDGHGSLAGYLAYGDANQITLDLADRLLPVVVNAPVIGGIGAADPYRDIPKLITSCMERGYSGITNVPTAGIYDGNFRKQIDHTGLGYPKEIELVRLCRERDIFTVAYAFTPQETQLMAEAGADVIGAHVGLTTGGTIGAGYALDLDAACTKTQEMCRAARAARAEIIVVAHGGPFEDTAAVQQCFDSTDVDGFLGASTIERLPVEAALSEAAKAYLDLRLKP